MSTRSSSISITGYTNVSGVRMSAWVYVLLALALTTPLARAGWFPHGPDTRGRPYCSTRRPMQCCPGRDDSCTVPILDSVCYCDQFCRHSNVDCCPDYRDTCVGRYSEAQHIAPEVKVINNCHHKGAVYEPGTTISANCNNCSCTDAAVSGEYNWQCTQKICLIRTELIDFVKAGSYGWKPARYPFFWGLTLAEGIQYRLGTFEPIAPVKRMSSLRGHSNVAVPPSFDARRQWPGLIHPVLDQGNCAASWAFSTISVASDRLSIHSGGALRQPLSPQNLISCNNDTLQRGCEGGHLGRAWWYMRHTGVVSEACYPYESGDTRAAGRCQLRRPVRHARARVLCPSNWRTTSKVFQASPPYRIAPNERDIMKEIMVNGPVQATMVVKEDFYMYRSGVYRHSLPTGHGASNHRRTGFHSVKILGWGTDYSSGRRRKYWLCANSWGSKWGEDGYFRIQRGTNECRIESFVIGAWGRVHGRTISRPLRRRSRYARRRHARRPSN